MESVANANLCTRHDMISWVSYPYGGQSCYVYPRYLLDGTEWKLIDPNAFPNAGAFQAVITGGASPSDMNDRYGSVVVARINSDTIDENFTTYQTNTIPTNSGRQLTRHFQKVTLSLNSTCCPTIDSLRN